MVTRSNINVKLTDLILNSITAQDSKNKEFHVESYVPEEYSSTELNTQTVLSVAQSIVSKKLLRQKNPYYLPLTDVVDSGDADSEYEDTK